MSRSHFGPFGPGEALCFAEPPELSAPGPGGGASRAFGLLSGVFEIRLKVPGVRLARAVPAGTLLCQVPSQLHFSRRGHA